MRSEMGIDRPRRAWYGVAVNRILDLLLLNVLLLSSAAVGS